MNGIYINLTDKNGEEVYDLINEYRFSKRQTWKQTIIASLYFAMLADGVDEDKLKVMIEYLKK